MKVDIKPVDRLILKTVKEFSAIAQDAYVFFERETPIRTGNARRNTQLKGNEIQANYAYAQRLDDGYSRQAPRGMTEPTERYIETVLVPRAVRRINNGQ